MSSERTSPRLIPVLDVIGAEVVHAVGGQRDAYWPVKSRLTDSTRPLDVARALLAASGAAELYVADLDAIRWGMFDLALTDLLAGIDADVLLDRGGLGPKPAPPNVREIYSLECRLPSESYHRHARTRGAVFSVELRDGRMVEGWQDWGLPSAAGALGLVHQAYELGYRAFVILDLARVGTGQGSGTEALLGAIRAELPEVELIAGGGVKNWGDIDRLGEAGADAVLVASALHDRTLAIPRPSQE